MNLFLVSDLRQSPRSLGAQACALALVSLGFLSLGACGSKEEKAPAAKTAPAPRPALTVTVVAPESASVVRNVQADGNIMAWHEANVGAEMTGRIESVSVQVGDKVKHFQELARFDTNIPQAEFGQLEAAEQEAVANYQEAQAAADRAKKLQQQGFMGEQMLTQYATREATAKARMEQARAARLASKLRLQNAVVRATADGVVSKVEVVTGSILPAGTELFRLIQDGRLEWRAQVTATEMNQIKAGMTVSVDLGAGQQVQGKVRSVAPTVDLQTRSGLVYVDLQASPYAREGMYVKGQIHAGQNNALLLPQSALVLRDGYSYVMKLEGQNHIRQTVVKLGQRQGDAVEILDGISPEDRVVSSGGAFLADGDTVSVVSAAASAVPAATPAVAALAAGH